MTISFMINDKLKKALEKEAKKQNRSLSNFVDTVLRQYMENKGIDWEKEEDE